VSYDGALDPLGSSQVLPCVLGLAERGVGLHLVTFEKPERWADAARREGVARQAAAAGVTWTALRYHRRPRLPGTLWDLVRGARAVSGAVRTSGAEVVHARGEVAAAAARLSCLPRRVALLHDPRGLFSDERAEAGSWRAGGLLDRLVRRTEVGNLRRAQALVTLTEAGLPAFRTRQPDLPPHRVIPTCVDLRRFRPRAAGEGEPEFALAYVGSLGTWYLAREMVDFAREAGRALGGRVLFLTPQVEEAWRAGAEPGWADVASAPPEAVPGWLRRARASFFFVRPSPAKRASCPTKLAESLAAGLPVAANRGIGDLDGVLEHDGVGVLVEGFSPVAYRRAAEKLRGLLADPDVSGRCRRLAQSRYGLEAAVAAYHELYAALAHPR
jgi:glycosyltransferase involved in cell wall biosynthesis